MKKVSLFIVALVLLTACKRKDIKAELNLTGRYEGTITGYAQPVQIDGNVNLDVTHQGDSITAIISSPQNLAQGGWLTYQAVVIGDSILTGSFKEANAFPSIVNGKILDNGNELQIETSGNDASYNYFRVKIHVFRQL